MKKVSILIPFVRNTSLLKECVKKIKKNTKVPHEILVLNLGEDNLSSWAKINKIKLYSQKLPFYFSQSCNYLASKAEGDYLLFLNPDTIPREDFLEHLLEPFQSPICAISGAKLVYPQVALQKGAIQHAGVIWKGDFPTPSDVPEHIGYMESGAGYNETSEVKAVTGACMLVKKEAFNKLKGFDESYKNGYEDIDICIRAKSKGYEVYYVGSAELVHFVSGSMGTDGKSRTSGEFHDENLRTIFKKFTKHKILSKPVRQYKMVKKNSKGGYVNRLLIGTPTTGEVRMEWVLARYGQIIPTNWSSVQVCQFLNPFAPQGYLVADAQNLIVKAAIEQDFEWLLLVEQDNVLPDDAFLRWNRYINSKSVPVVSGLYYTKSSPTEPLVYRGRGTSAYSDFDIGDRVWCDGVPTGALLIHMGILRAMWDESPEYMAGDTKTRRVFDTPRKLWFDPENGSYNNTSGTSDLDWCTRVMEGKYFEKAGWGEFQKKKYPFLVDTNIFVKHVDPRGRMFP